MQPEAESIFLARQPILDGRRRLVAYELLFRSSGEAQQARIESPERATARVAVDAFLNMGAGAVLGDLEGFLNVDLATLNSEAILALPAERVVLEVLEVLESVGPVVMDRCRELQAEGFELALDDYVPDDPREPMLEIADYVKVDLQLTAPDALPALARSLRKRGPKLLAEKVETQEDVDRCAALGFELYQGYFFAKPSTLEGRKLDATRLSLLEAFNALSGDAELAQLEDIFKRDARLGLHLLRIANSAGPGARERIASLRHAIQFVGRAPLRRWALLLLCGLGEVRDSRGPVFEMAAVRARFVEFVHASIPGAASEHVANDSAFLVGLLSLADTILGVPLPELLGQLHVEDAIRRALLGREGTLGATLEVVELLEQDDFDALDDRLRELRLPSDRVAAAQRDAYAWQRALDPTALDDDGR